MRIAYCSMLLPEEKKLTEKTNERLPAISVHKVTMAEIQGIDKNNDRYIDIFNIINVVNFPKFKQLIFKTEKWNHSTDENHVDYHIGYVNLIGVKYILQFINLYKYLDRWMKKGLFDDNVICVHHIHLPSMLAAAMIKKKYGQNVKTCFNTGDLPGVWSTKQDRSFKQFFIEKLVYKNIMRTIKKFDSYVFVTEDMAVASGVEEKPHVIVECTYTLPPYYVERKESSKEKIIFYAGAIREDYGIIHLLNAFQGIEESNYRLIIAGGGPAESIVRERAKNDNRIDYIGFVSPELISDIQSKSRVIVSPRQSYHEFVKYSFPSKSLDSMASGIPYVAHKLPCDPPEYEDYICYAESESDDSLRRKIIEIAEKSDDEWKLIGDKAKEFVLEHKNPEIMTRKIVKMWESLFDQRDTKALKTN